MKIPRQKSSTELKHRKQKRLIEVSYAIEAIKNYLETKSNYEKDKTEILEFGCGEGFQIPYLRNIGNVVASDIYCNENIKSIKNLEFVECSIDQTPFGNNRFDVIFSNQVIEHIHNLDGSFAELHRIGKPDCLYAFAVPTNIWLLISLPVRYIGKPKKIFHYISKFLFKKNKNENSNVRSGPLKLDTCLV